MPNHFVYTQCILCGATATMSQTDRNNAEYYKCSSPQCGDYEISRKARASMEQSTRRRSLLSAEAAQARDAGKVLRIYNDNQFQLTLSRINPEEVR